MKHSSTLAIFCVVTTLYLLSGEAAARGYGVECALVDDDLVEVDGMIDDWEGIAPRESGRRDSGIAVRCAHSESTLYLAVSVSDDKIIRTANKPRRKVQDSLMVAIGAGAFKHRSKLEVFPGTRGFEPIAKWRGRRIRSPVRVEDSQQPGGWSLEAAVPLGQLADWGRGTPKLKYSIDYADADGGSDRSAMRMVGTIRFAGATNVYRSFMHATKLERSQVKVDRLVDIDGARGVERVIAGRNVVGVLNDEYRYVTLPIANPADVLALEVVDLAGDGKHSVVVHYRQHGNGGSRDVVSVWNLLANGQFSRTLAFEVRKQMDGYLLSNTWRLQAKRGKRARGHDIVTEVAEVQGWDEDSYVDTPAEDLRPILTPWGEQQSAVYHFEGDTSFGGEPLP